MIYLFNSALKIHILTSIPHYFTFKTGQNLSRMNKKGCNPGMMTLQGTNIYVVGNGKRRVLIEAGQDNYPEYILNLTGLLKEQNVSIEHLILTHWHKDHIGALPELSEHLKNDSTTVYKFPRLEEMDDPVPNAFKFQNLKDNQIFKVDGANLRVVYTPGHTSDHAILYLEEEKAVFSGDCILGEGTTVFEDLKEYMESLQKILSLKPSKIYPGHGPVVENPSEVIEYYIHHRNQREKQILELMESNPLSQFSSMDIVKGIYKDVPEHLHIPAEINVTHHLTKLLKENKIIQTGELFKISRGSNSSL